MTGVRRRRLLVLALSTSIVVATALLVGAQVGDTGSRGGASTRGSSSGVTVLGNRLVDEAGGTVALRGFNTSGTEYACVEGWGFFDLPGAEPNRVPVDAVEGMARWRGANTVRVPLNEQCWLGLGTDPAYAGVTYQRAIADYVALLRAHGFVVVLDLHRSAPADGRSLRQEQMPDRDHSLDFWRQVASTYRDDGSVIFDLFNEPWPFAEADSDRAWSCWRDGGCRLTSQNTGRTYTAAGMNEIIAVIRSTGATNVLAVGGIYWAEMLDRWLEYRPSDPLGQLMASFHSYAFNRECADDRCYDDVLGPLAAEVPLYAGEVGPDTAVEGGARCRPDGPGRQGFSAEVLDWLDRHHAHYTVWTWNAWGDCYSLVGDGGTPTRPWGRQVQLRLAAGPHPA